MIRRPPRSTLSSSSAASDVYKRQAYNDTLSDGNYTNLIDSASVKPLININYSSPVEYGSSSNLTINISGYHNSSYIVYKNGTNIANGSYLDGVSFNVSVNTSVRTIWNYTVWANDSFDYNTNSTTVWVTIIDTTPPCLLYTSDAADEEDSVDLGGRRII